MDRCSPVRPVGTPLCEQVPEISEATSPRACNESATHTANGAKPVWSALFRPHSFLVKQHLRLLPLRCHRRTRACCKTYDGAWVPTEPPRPQFGAPWAVATPEGLLDGKGLSHLGPEEEGWVVQQFLVVPRQR